MSLDELAKVYSFSQLRAAKSRAKTLKVLSFLKKIEDHKLHGSSRNDYRKVGFR